MRCANYMDFEAIRRTVKEHHEKCGPRGEPMSYNLSDVNLIKNCTICDFGGTGLPVIDGVAKVLEERAVALQETVKRLTGEPLKRVCFKELVSNDSTKRRQDGQAS